MSFKVYIPARYAATRLPGKPLLEIHGKPLIQYVYERALASGAAEVVIATDDERIAAVARGFGATACMTSPELPSGSDRIAAAARQRGEAEDQVIVNLQGDEPRMPAAVIRQVAALGGRCGIATSRRCASPCSAAQLFDPNVVKVVRDHSQRALYFSRAPIPWSRDEFASGQHTTAHLALYRRHVGIYAYRVGFLTRFVAAPPGELERIESLEQLRALGFGARIVAADALAPCGVGVDTPADLERLRQDHH